MYGEECVTRTEAEKMIRKSIEDYLSIDQLQDVLTIVFGDDIMVIEDEDRLEEDDE